MPTLADTDYLTVAAMAAAGARHEDIARRLGMGRETWRLLREADEKAAGAFAAGRSELHEQLMSKLVEKAKRGEVAPLIFCMKVLYGYRDNAIAPLEIQHNVKIMLPAALSQDDYEKLRRIESQVPIEAEVISRE